MSSAFDLVELRKRLGLKQADMAKHMGMGMRAYQDLEAEPARVLDRHQLLAEAVSLLVAQERRDPMLAAPRMRAAALDIAQMMRGE
ncbi:hypothetical protein [Chelatococcus reniformis]|uniref:Uncharacterized protein n=1 Tax=Chelatococcus reniformis TaxID=1494448 RepID=A0A916UDG8_9HYPH|nr:hypothetical protein [Chelatococcus reniformis]GGC68449.1 hypothetical protein GCM10010994_28790 [Chelatococcus reniformis]